ncbi:MAG: hypothetical protein K9N55_18195 [Phycisphaerae bacterium]|nr:hypothetical protein [Phycisphaerae bacterium]
MVKMDNHGRSRQPKPNLSPPNPEPVKPRWSTLTKGERFSEVWHLFLKGIPVIDIAKQLHAEFDAPTSFNRGSIYKMIRTEAQAKRLCFLPSSSDALADSLHARFRWLKEIAVAHTTRFEDVAYRGAEMLVTSLKKAEWIDKEEVHIGFAGGHAMRLLVQTFAHMLSETDDELPKKLVFHALVAGFDVLEPTTDPNTFFTLFQDETKFTTKFSFVGLQAPPRVQAEQYAMLRESDWFKDSYRHAHKLDIIVTSAANWSDKDSTFRKSMQRSPNAFNMLDQARCAGDMFWLPVGPDGPLEIDTEIRSMTLLELKEIADYVRKGKHVYLVLGPCAGCKQLKSEILSAILNSRRKLISHLISDTGTVREVLRKLPQKPGSAN